MPHSGSATGNLVPAEIPGRFWTNYARTTAGSSFAKGEVRRLYGTRDPIYADKRKLLRKCARDVSIIATEQSRASQTPPFAPSLQSGL